MRPYEERAVEFIFDRRTSPRNAIFCCLSDAVATAADFLDAGRAFGMCSGGWIRHRRIRWLALGLHGVCAVQRPLPARRQARRRDRLHDRCGYLSCAGGTMAEF